MHAFKMPDEIVDRVVARVGRPHPFDRLTPERTALVVIDMQNYFMKPGYMGEVPLARGIVPTANRLAAGVRAVGGHVVDPADAQIVKKRFSAFIQGSSSIDAHLQARGIDTVLIAGTATNVCCESSARDAMMLNYKVVMISDATATYTDVEHQAALASFYAIFGDVQTTDEALASLRHGARKAA